MRRWFRPRSRCFRAMLGMALLAWAAFAATAIAHPLPMGGAVMAHALAAQGIPLAHHDGMPTMAMMHMAHAAAASSMTVGHGDGCCQTAHCQCAASCTALASIARMTVTVAAPRGSTFASVDPTLLPMRVTRPLRPPIA